ncbi:regulatory protein RecX [Halopseudomonas salina]|uniref:Regulatory protein RecX n=1 Tax=Halopseudomonas salina TaxID=1323744 RepID=A0ABQ1NWC3_9GAMM|nr:regulatory protein RecX [Halopseudomonas salina]GGC85951.1 regulatory protein RecX [Halopseudomonas salina]
MFGRQQQLETPQEIRRSALDLLARREHSRLEMLRKLKLRGASTDQCEAVIDQLQEDGLLSDERFCEAYVHARVQRGYGPQRLAEELRERGVAEHLVSDVLGLDWDWSKRASVAFAKRFPEGPAEDLKQRAKQLNFMRYRGFADFRLD